MLRKKPPHHAVDRSRQYILALAVTVGLILYGSLYPFAFYNEVDPARGVRDLLATWKGPASLGDVLANILLYLPFGFFAAKTLSRMSMLFRVLTVLLAGAVLSVSVEFSQLYDLERVSAMSDVYANSFGAFLGALVGTALSADLRLPYWQELRRRPFAASLLFCWLAYRLFPYVPVIDAHKYWHAVRPLLVGPSPTFADLLRHFASWLAVGALLEYVWGPVKARYCLLALLAAVFCARIGIVNIELSQAELIGGTAAAAIWVTWLYANKRRMPIVAATLAVAVLVEALRPFQFLTVARPFGWVPFLALIDGEISISVPSVLAKFFLYGSLVWSLCRLGLRSVTATAVGAIFVFLLHYLQIYLPGRSAEITDALIVLMAGALMSTMDGGAEMDWKDSGPAGGSKPDDIRRVPALEGVSSVDH